MLLYRASDGCILKYRASHASSNFYFIFDQQFRRSDAAACVNELKSIQTRRIWVHVITVLKLLPPVQTLQKDLMKRW